MKWSRGLSTSPLVCSLLTVFLCGSDLELGAQSAGTFRVTSSMITPRTAHTATLLPNGKVLIAGGQTPRCCVPPTIFSSAELYDPATGTFMATGDMTTLRT